MNWNLAVEKNREALKRILATLVAMVAVSSRPSTRPRHLHRYVLSLLRPAEAATRRLIIVAARAIAAEPVQSAPGTLRPEPRSVPNGIAAAQTPGRTPARTASRTFSFSLLDPLVRGRVRLNNAS